MLFLRKTAETIWNLPPFYENPRPPLSTNPLISEQFFPSLHLCPNFKNDVPPPLIANFGGPEETNEAGPCSVLVFSVHEFQHPPYQSAF